MRKPGRARQMFLYAAPFLGLASFKVWAGRGSAPPESLLAAALAVLAYCALVIFLASRWDKPTYFDWAVGGYFAAISSALAIWPETAGGLLTRYSVTGIYICLFCAAFFPPLLELDPFTYHYARKVTPEELWENPIFVSINRIMTYAWAGLFALCIVISLYPSLLTRALIPISLILGVGMPFNLLFPNRYLKRLGLPSLAEQKRMAAEGQLSGPTARVQARLPENAKEAILGMPVAFDPEVAGDLTAVIGFVVTGSDGFEAYLRIENHACTLEERPTRTPDLLIRTPAEVWLAIARGEMDGSRAFMTRAYTAQGNLGILLRMNRIFGGEGKRSETTDAKPLTPSPESATDSQTHPSPTEPTPIHKEKAMKVLAINSSPRGEGQSKTQLMLDALVTGMQDAGAQVDVVHLRQKKVNDCIGCYTCWTKTPGICIHKDDMTRELFPKLIEADLLVLASPLYHYTVNAAMKGFIERTLPMIQPFFEQDGERTRHPLRHEHPDVVVLSVAGFPEMSVFDQLTQYVKFLFGTKLIAEIYRPASETLPVLKRRRQEILEATTQAGRELVLSRRVAPQTLEKVTQPIGDPTTFAKLGNLAWKTCIAEGITLSEFQQRHMVPRPDSLDAFMMIMPMGFNADAAGSTRAVIQFDFSGQVEGSCHFRIEDGKIEALAGPPVKADLTIQTPFEVWVDIMTKKADGQQMFMQQKYRVTGDLSLLLRMNELFRG
jgi:multimeric flavodoxin WrbA/putative sterol carrier protein